MIRKPEAIRQAHHCGACNLLHLQERCPRCGCDLWRNLTARLSDRARPKGNGNYYAMPANG
jgi:uncharacterized paraquat-inducible protein A